MSHDARVKRTVLHAQELVLTRPPRRDGSIFSLNVKKVEVKEGESLFVCGPSGCGKSTLLRILAGLEWPETGSVRFGAEGDIDLVGCTASVWRATRKLVGVVHQDPREYLNDRRLTTDIVADVLAVHGMDGIDPQQPSGRLTRLIGKLPWVQRARRRLARAEKLLGRVGITAQQARRTPSKLSGGQRQRIAIARALVSDPEILFLDEPTSALDVSVQAGVMKLLAELKAERGLTVVMVTHDLGLARQFADRVIVMEAGRIVDDGDAEKVFAAPDSELTKSMVAASRPSLTSRTPIWASAAPPIV